MENSNQLFVVLVFPEKPDDKTHLASLASSVMDNLSRATGQAPELIHPNKDKLAFLVEGDSVTISNALSNACLSYDRWLLVRAGLPVEDAGLSRASLLIRQKAS